MAMTANRAAQVEEIMEHIRNRANDVLYRVGRIQSADDMSTDEFTPAGNVALHAARGAGR